MVWAAWGCNLPPSFPADKKPRFVRGFFIRYQKGVKHGWAYGYDETGKEIGKKYFYHGRHLEGKILAEKMKQMKELGINPNE